MNNLHPADGSHEQEAYSRLQASVWAFLGLSLPSDHFWVIPNETDSEWDAGPDHWQRENTKPSCLMWWSSTWGMKGCWLRSVGGSLHGRNQQSLRCQNCSLWLAVIGTFTSVTKRGNPFILQEQQIVLGLNTLQRTIVTCVKCVWVDTG